MKTALTILVLITSSYGFSAGNPSAAKDYSFKYNTKQFKNFTIVRTAKSQEDAFRLAAKDCFNKLTNGKYPGEEKGLEIIDICANPKI